MALFNDATDFNKHIGANRESKLRIDVPFSCSAKDLARQMEVKLTNIISYTELLPYGIERFVLYKSLTADKLSKLLGIDYSGAKDLIAIMLRNDLITSGYKYTSNIDVSFWKGCKSRGKIYLSETPWKYKGLGAKYQGLNGRMIMSIL